MPGRKITTGTFPIKVVLEKERFGGEDLSGAGAVFGTFDATVPEGAPDDLEAGGLSPATVSWRS